MREFRAYASRARWIRTANDSYFTAMTYPEGLPARRSPSDIHDATWGVVERGLWRRHPPDRRRPRRHGRRGARGVRRVLGLVPEAPVVEAPLPPPIQ